MSDFTTEAFTLLGVGLFTIGLRTYARWSTVGFRDLKADDYLMLLAAVVYSLETAAAYSVGAKWHGLANNGMTDAERAALDPSSHEWALRVGGSKTQVAGWSLYTLLLWLLKTAMCVFYMRLTEGIDHMVVRINVGFAFIGSTYVAVLLSILLGCRPLSKNWQIYPDPGNFCQPAISKIDIFVTVVLNVITDFYLMSIPLPMLWKAKISRRRKCLLLILFSGGIFVTMAGILRCVLILTNPITGAEEAGSWAVRETFVAVMTSNLPMLAPLVRRWMGKAADSRIASSMRGKSSRSAGTGSEGFAMERPDRKAPRSVNPITNATFAESEERIIEQGASATGTAGQTYDDGNESNGSFEKGGISVRKDVDITVKDAEVRHAKGRWEGADNWKRRVESRSP